MTGSIAITTGTVEYGQFGLNRLKDERWGTCQRVSLLQIFPFLSDLIFNFLLYFH
jgi:hypothetical protein